MTAAGKRLMTFEVTLTSHTLAEYRARGGTTALAKALRQMKPADVTKEVLDSGIQGRGGAAFPMGRKWQGVNLEDGKPHFLCANADEGEPGTFKDRWILENAPHLLVEAMAIASYALGVRHAFVYMRGEFDLARRRLEGAIEEAYAAKLLGERILGTAFSLDLNLVRGAGAYVCGEASGLLASVEGKKGFPRNRPPRMTVQGLYRLPTVVNNVETLSNVPWIITHGAAKYREAGTPKSPGTRLISVSGHVNRPGVYEVPFGYPFDRFLREDCGGVTGGRALKAVVPGGISTKVLTAPEIAGLPMDHASLEAAGSSLGSGGMIVVAEGTCMVRLLQVMLRFYHHESCGQCTPCREGTGWMRRIIDRIAEGRGEPGDVEQLYRVAHFNDGLTICGLGDAGGFAAEGILNKFRPEFDYAIANGRLKLGGNLL